MLLAQPYPHCACHMEDNIVPSKLMRSCSSLGSLWPLQLQRPLQMLGSPEMLDILISVPDPSGWIISLVDLERHGLQAYLCHSATVTIVTRHLLPGPARSLQGTLHVLILVTDRKFPALNITVYHVPDSLLGTRDPDESETVRACRDFTVCIQGDRLRHEESRVSYGKCQ